MAEEKEKANLFNPILVGLLVVAAFFLGNFYAKVQMMKDGASKNQEVIAADTAAPPMTPEETGPETVVATAAGIETFQEKADAEIIKEDGLPVVFLFSTTWCPHCTWIKDTFNSVVNEYVSAGKIKAYHWELDINDDALTAEVETAVVPEHMNVYKEFNPRGSIPTFVIGGKYFRVGNGHEQADDLEAEAVELRAAIDDIL